MTEIRKSLVYQKETAFGEFKDGDTTGWVHPPIGYHFSFTVARQAEGIYGTGDKFREAVAYGPLSGSWNLSFVLDYDHLEPFDMIFENCEDVTETNDKNETKTIGFKFTRKNSTRVNSYRFRIKQMNHTAGGGESDDEIITLVGCVAKQMSVSRSASSGHATVEMNGTFSNMKTETGRLDSTDVDDSGNGGTITEYSCMFLGDISSSNYVADVDAHSFTIENNIGLVYSTCKAFASTFYEGRTAVQWNAQTYSNGPTGKFRFLPNSGGYDRTHKQPMCKGLKPAPTVTFTTFNGAMCKNDTAKSTTADPSIENAHDDSEKYMDFVFTDSVIKSMTYPKGEGSKMSDSLSSVDCKGVTITVKGGTKPWSSTGDSMGFTTAQSTEETETEKTETEKTETESGGSSA
jgi:hypothetical protein